MKKIFNYDETTGVYIGEGIAHTDPETGGALLPRNATTERPPAFNAAYRGNVWHLPETAQPEAVQPEAVQPEEVQPEKTTSTARSRPPKRRR